MILGPGVPTGVGMGRLFIEPVEEFNRSRSRQWFVVAQH